MYSDRTLTCSDCSQEFTFTASEQEFYADRGFSDPRRCGACRATRKAQRGGADSGGRSSGYSSGGSGYSSGGSGYSSGGGGYSSGGSSYGGNGGSRGSSYGDRPQREMFEATCSDCGKTARVPFRPTSGKPVYCTDCFAKRRA
jgi:CxxC-x17-CxxC domain-containing protein